MASASTPGQLEAVRKRLWAPLISLDEASVSPRALQALLHGLIQGMGHPLDDQRSSTVPVCVQLLLRQLLAAPAKHSLAKRGEAIWDVATVSSGHAVEAQHVEALVSSVFPLALKARPDQAPLGTIAIVTDGDNLQLVRAMATALATQAEDDVRTAFLQAVLPRDADAEVRGQLMKVVRDAWSLPAEGGGRTQRKWADDNFGLMLRALLQHPDLDQVHMQLPLEMLVFPDEHHTENFRRVFRHGQDLPAHDRRWLIEMLAEMDVAYLRFPFQDKTSLPQQHLLGVGDDVHGEIDMPLPVRGEFAYHWARWLRDDERELLLDDSDATARRSPLSADARANTRMRAAMAAVNLGTQLAMGTDPWDSNTNLLWESRLLCWKILSRVDREPAPTSTQIARWTVAANKDCDAQTKPKVLNWLRRQSLPAKREI